MVSPMNGNVVSLNVYAAQRLLKHIAHVIDNEITITQEEHMAYISNLGHLSRDTSLGNDLQKELMMAKQHLRGYSRFLGTITE